MVKAVNDHGLEAAIIETKGFLVTAFLQIESKPCEHFLPELEALSLLLKGQVEFVRIEVTENPTVVEDLGVTAVPTTIVWKDGEEIARYEGPYNRKALKGRISDLMVTGGPGNT